MNGKKQQENAKNKHVEIINIICMYYIICGPGFLGVFCDQQQKRFITFEC